MAPPKFKVIIAGGGIVGLALGVMLERAGIDYLILEASAEIRPLGAVVYLGPPVLRAFEQLGLLDDMIRESNVMTGITLLDHRLNKICRLAFDYSRDKYGYDTLTIVRPKLYDILLSRIPAYKVLFGKHVVSTDQNAEGIKVRCADGSTYNGNILVAADGGASAIRKAMYEEIRKRSKKVPHPADYEQPKLDQRCIVGVCEPLSTKKFPILASKNCELILVMPKEINCMIWFVPMSENRFGWGVASPLPSTADSSSLPSSESAESPFDTPGSPASIHGMGKSFSAMSTTSYSPTSSAASSPIQPPYGDGDYLNAFHSYNNSNQSYSSSGSPVANSSVNQYSSNAVKKRRSLGRLSRHSASSSGSEKGFQHFPAVLQLNESSTLDLKELPNDRVWGKLDEKYTIEEAIREQQSPFGGTLGDIIDATSKKMTAMVVAEEKFFHTWHFGRTVLLGDGMTHKMIFSYDVISATMLGTINQKDYSLTLTLCITILRLSC
ncbi:hypothetical protein EDD21DRAFT_219228 [Dissophora ornata]|nr:hypothetical protein EDD21DRAFT_219228 [Dissophora ornata]